MHLLSLLSDATGYAGDYFWNAPIFQKDRWEEYMRFFRLSLTLGTALFLVLEARARKLGRPLKRATTYLVTTIAIVCSFGSFFDWGNPATRYSEFYHRHEFYHYYLGAKYSSELSYTRLYECTAIAEVELGREANIRSRDIRDLRVNLIKPMTDSYVFSDPGQCKRHFSVQNWESFKKDVDWFYRSAAGQYWENMVKDHGYNPPPVWTMTGKLFASMGPADDGFFKALASIDVVLHLGSVLILGWAFGWRVLLVGAVFWGVQGPANFYWTGGAFLRQDWLFLFVAAVALARKRYFGMAGAALTWSTLLRVFPIIAFAGWGVVIAFETVRRIRAARAGNPPSGTGLLRFLHPDHQRLIGGCIVAAGILIPASVVVTGPESYREFYEHTIHTHNSTPLTNHMGLKSVMAHTWEGRMRFARNDALDDAFQGWKQGRIDRSHDLRHVRHAITLGFGLWIAWALRRTKALWVAQALSLPLLVCMVELTCYYYSFFMIAAVLIRQRPTIGPPFLTLAAVSALVLSSFYFVDDEFVAMTWLYIVFSVLMLWAYSRPFSVARLRNWWNGQRETERTDTPSPPLNLTP